MANTDLSFVVRVRDEATAAFNKISGSLDKLQPTFQKMAAVGTVALGSIAAIGGKAVKDYADAEKSAAMLEHAVLNVSHATKEQLQATNDLADALERKGVLDGDNIKTGLAQLSTFGLSNDAVRGLGGALADLAVNQFGVSASGEQLSDTANTIAKALNGQFGVLEKSGIRFTEAQQSAIKFGTEMEKVTAINEGFAQNLKFTNEVALGTTEGQMAKAAVAAGNLSESLGAVLTPIVQQLTATIVPLLEKVAAWIQANPELTKKLVIAGAAIAAVVAVVGTLGLIIPTVITGFTVLAGLLPLVGAGFTLMLGPVGLVILAIAALVAGGVLLYKHWDEVRAKAIEIWEAIREFLERNWRTILSVVTFGLSSIILMFVENLEPITNAWNNIWNGVKSYLISIMDGAKNVIMGTINWVIDKLNGAINLANQAIELANRVPGVNIGTIGNIPQLAEGGIVSRPTLALIGESGPEAVVPLSRGGGYGGGTQVNISIGSFFGGNPEVAAREIGDLIIKRLQINARVG